jgi:hypothetical protein
MSVRMAGPVMVEELEGRRLLSGVGDTVEWDLQTPIAGELSEKGEVDYLRFEARAGEKIVFDSTGMKKFSILDSDGKTQLDHLLILDGVVPQPPGRLVWEAPHNGTFYLSVEGYLAFLIDVPTGPYSLAAYKVDDSVRPEDGAMVAAGQSFSGDLSGAGDIDYYSFDAKAGTIYRFEITSDHLPGAGDTAHYAFGVVEAGPWRPMPPQPQDAEEAYPGHNIYYVNLDFQKALRTFAEWVAPGSGRFHFSIAPLDGEHAGAYTVVMSQRGMPCDPQREDPLSTGARGKEEAMTTSRNSPPKSSSHSRRHQNPRKHHRRPGEHKHERPAAKENLHSARQKLLSLAKD